MTSAQGTPVPIRDAATVIVTRSDPAARTTRVLMGQRGAKAAFMPNKFVFPGGALDMGDKDIALDSPLSPVCLSHLEEDAPSALGPALAVAAIRELWEETGLVLGVPGAWNDTPPEDWVTFAARGFRPAAAPLEFVFRAITPPGRPRRFDARFFLLDAAALQGDLDDFSEASDELSHLQWVPLDEVRRFDLPFITEVVLAEVAERLRRGSPAPSVPFFRNDDEESLFLRLYGTGSRD